MTVEEFDKEIEKQLEDHLSVNFNQYTFAVDLGIVYEIDLRIEIDHIAKTITFKDK